MADPTSWTADQRALEVARSIENTQPPVRRQARIQVLAESHLRLEAQLAARDQQIALLRRELSHLVRLLEPLERDGGLEVPGLATLNGARAALAAVPEPKREGRIDAE